MAELKSLSPDERAWFITNIRDGIYHLAACWDALRGAEHLIEDEIEVSAIASLAGETDFKEPGDAYKTDRLTDEQIIKHLTAEGIFEKG